MSAAETSADIAQYYVYACQLSFTYAIQALMNCTSKVKSVIKKAAFSPQNSDSASPDERLTNLMRHSIAYIWIRIEPRTMYDP